MNIARKLASAPRTKAVVKFKAKFGIFRQTWELSPSEAAKALKSGKTVEVEETFRDSFTVGSYEAKTTTQESTFLDSEEELNEFHSYRTQHATDTERQKLSAKFRNFNGASTWAISDVDRGWVGVRSVGDEGLTDFEAAGRVLEGETVSLNHIDLRKLQSASNIRDGLKGAVESHFIATPLDLEELSRF